MAKYQNTREGKAAPKLNKRPEIEFEIKVKRVLDGQYGTIFDLVLNNVTIYGCRICQTKDGEPFVGFPQKKDRKDPNKYWSVCYAPLSKEQTGEIMKQISYIRALDDEDTDE